MKKIYALALGCAALLATSSCSDDKFTDQYQDPSKTQTVSCPALMVGVWQASNTWMNPVYYRYYVSSTTSGLFSGIIGHTNSKDRFAGTGQGYFNERWRNFYNTVTQYRVLETEFNNLPEEEKEDLDEVNTYLNGRSLTANASTYLNAEDYVNNGDITLWRKYVNSLRLRVATHLASNGDLVSEARAAIKTMLENPGTYPMVDLNSDNITVTQTDDDQFDFDRDLQNAIENSTYNRMSGPMQRALNANTNNPDPRLEVLYDSNWNNEYIGLDPSETLTEQETNMSISTHGTAKYYAALDTSTFTRNPGFPGLWMTAAEVAFMKAEAYANNWATGNAKSEYINGIKLSTEFYFDLNSTGTYRDALTPPSTAVVEAYAETQWDASNPQKSILTQRWIHHGAIQEYEAWNVVRRTGYPEIYFKRDPQSVATPLPLDRIQYPSDEKDYNSANLNAHLGGKEDSWYAPLNWMKSNWYTTIE